MDRFLSISYWFDRMPGDPDLGFWRLIFFIAGACIVASFAALFGMRMARRDGLRRRLFGRIAAWGLVVGPVYLLLGFFRFQRAFMLSMRLWYLLWTGFALLWALWIIRYWIIVLPKRAKLRDQRQEYLKYLPK